MSDAFFFQILALLAIVAIILIAVSIVVMRRMDRRGHMQARVKAISNHEVHYAPVSSRRR